MNRLTGPPHRLELPLAPGRRAKAVLAAALVATLLLMSAQARPEGRGPTLLERAGLAAASPLVAAGEAAASLVRSAVSEGSSYLGARSENLRLRREVERLRRQNMTLAAAASETRELQRLLAAKASFPGVECVGSLVHLETQGGYRRALVDVGTSDGVRPGSVLAVPEGLVGRVTVVAPAASKALLLTDADFAAGVRVVRTGEEAVARGEGREMRVAYLSSLSSARPGDVLETAGIDGVFPPGIPVARITRVSKSNDLFLDVSASPLAPLDRIRRVLVLAPLPSTDVHP